MNKEFRYKGPQKIIRILQNVERSRGIGSCPSVKWLLSIANITDFQVLNAINAIATKILKNKEIKLKRDVISESLKAFKAGV